MKPHRRYLRDLAVALLIYMLLLFGSRYALTIWQGPLPVRVVLSLSPVLGFTLMIRAMYIFIDTWDELKRRFVMEASVITIMTVAFGTIAWGFLEGDVGAPRLPTIWIMPILFAVFGISLFIVKRRYQ